MNRATRRKELHEKERTFTYKESDLNKIIHREAAKLINDNRDKIKKTTTMIVSEMLMATLINVLHSHHKFGKRKLQNVVHQINSLSMSIADGQVDPTDIVKYAKDLGITNVFSYYV